MKAGAVCCLRTILRLFICVKICVVESPLLLARARGAAITFLKRSVGSDSTYSNAILLRPIGISR